MVVLKLSRLSSRTARNIFARDSLACLEEGAFPVQRTSTRTDQIWQKELAKRQLDDVKRFSRRRFKTREFLPPVVIFVFPCVYYYASSWQGRFYSLPDKRDGFHYIVLVLFFSSVLISMRIAYPQLNFYHLRHITSRIWDCVAVMCIKSVNPFLVATLDGDQRKENKLKRTVTWTIGSKSQRDKHSGEGVQAYSSGDVYEGEFHQGRCSGSGVHHFYMSGRYEGDWVDGKYDGYGVETWVRGSRYRGQYKRGLREGYGVYRFYTGDVYSGEWASGQSHGCGVQTCADGSRYVGEFKWGIKYGFGHYHFRNGDTYAGEYFADKMHGYGMYQFSNGHQYEGSWHEGKRQGFGMYTFRNGETLSGYWHAGLLQTPTSHNHMEQGAHVSHSKVLHAVQDARSAAAKAAKAYDMPQIDERVNKTVAAANRAANAARVAAVKAVQKKLCDSSL